MMEIPNDCGENTSSVSWNKEVITWYSEECCGREVLVIRWIPKYLARNCPHMVKTRELRVRQKREVSVALALDGIE